MWRQKKPPSPLTALKSNTQIYKHRNMYIYTYTHRHTDTHIYIYRLFQKRCLGNILGKNRSWISSLTSVPSWHGIDNILSSQKGEKSDSTSSMLIFPHTMPAAMLNKENDHWGCSFCLQIFEYCLLVTRTPGTFAHLAADTTGCSCCNGIFPQPCFISSSFFFPILRKFNHQAWLGKKKKKKREKKKKERWHCNQAFLVLS